ncbi:MAG: DNA translocase FtsK 4TM domain-containing protein [Chitinophagaceae bacterium]|jgi:S-DNA-T family DNA segregation ATPase FtsK/SpoIIIE
MATTSKKTKITPKDTPIAPADTKRQIRLVIGTIILLIGSFITFSIVSYFFTWQTDQDQLLASRNNWNFLTDKESIITNWGGRLGALTSHTLVYKGVGILSITIGLWISLMGLYLVYDKKISRLAKYLRWVCLLLLIATPVLSYLLPDSNFSWGGAWGNESIAYLNGFIGKMGTGLILFATVSLMLFIIFSLDIRPMLAKAKTKAVSVSSNIASALTKEKAEFETEPIISPFEETASKITPEEKGTAEESNFSGSINDRFANAGHADNTPFTVTEKAPLTNEILQPAAEIIEEEMDEEEQAYANYNFSIPEKEKPKPIETDLSFEVKAPEPERAPEVPVSGHISIQSNEPYAPELDLPSYKFPTLDLLEDRAQEIISIDKEELEKNKNQIISTLRSFGIEIQRISATVGPTVTLYEIVPAEGVRISKIRNLEDDIALNLAALGIRIIAPIPGKGTIGIEVPNANKQIVSMRALLSSEKFINNKMSLPIALGKKIDNENYIVDLATMPHLLMAGATGQGKSVGINAVLVSLLYKKHPSQLKFVLVDPKKVELSVYKMIEKHFLAKLPNEEEAIITDTKKVINTLNALCIEMDNRYELLKEAGTRNIKEYNEKFISRRLNPEKGHKYLPFIVLVVDEFADLIMTAGKEVEMPIARLAQLARAVGIHLIVATQRPSVNVITGTIKANFPARIAFKVSAKVDSRTILDSGGAEQLVGRGDMLISHGSELLRIQCAFVDTPEVEKIVEFIGQQRGYPSAFELPEYEGEEGGGSGKVLDIGNRDELFEECARLIVQSQSGSTSNLQRRLNLGYNRAGRIMDQIEAAGIVGPAVGSKPREVYVKTEAELETYL